MMTKLPKAELIAKYSGVVVAEVMFANRSPGSVVKNFQTSFVCQVTSH